MVYRRYDAPTAPPLTEAIPSLNVVSRKIELAGDNADDPCHGTIIEC